EKGRGLDEGARLRRTSPRKETLPRGFRFASFRGYLKTDPRSARLGPFPANFFARKGPAFDVRVSAVDSRQHRRLATDAHRSTRICVHLCASVANLDWGEPPRNGLLIRWLPNVNSSVLGICVHHTKRLVRALPALPL